MINQRTFQGLVPPMRRASSTLAETLVADIGEQPSTRLSPEDVPEGLLISIEYVGVWQGIHLGGWIWFLTDQLQLAVGLIRQLGLVWQHFDMSGTRPDYYDLLIPLNFRVRESQSQRKIVTPFIGTNVQVKFESFYCLIKPSFHKYIRPRQS